MTGSEVGAIFLFYFLAIFVLGIITVTVFAVVALRRGRKAKHLPDGVYRMHKVGQAPNGDDLFEIEDEPKS